VFSVKTSFSAVSNSQKWPYPGMDVFSVVTVSETGTETYVSSAIIDSFCAHMHDKIVYKNLVNFTQQMFPSTLPHNFLSAIGIALILWSTDMCRLV